MSIDLGASSTQRNGLSPNGSIHRIGVYVCYRRTFHSLENSAFKHMNEILA